MATLTPGKPLTVETPELLVENQLPAGTHRFQLVVIDDSGLESHPTELAVTVREVVRGGGGRRPDIIINRDIFLRPDLILRTPRRPQ